MDVIYVRLQVSRQDIALLCHFFAGYEGIAIVRTVDAAQGLVELLVAPDFYTTALRLLNALAQELEVCLVDAGAAPPPPLPDEQHGRPL